MPVKLFSVKEPQQRRNHLRWLLNGKEIRPQSEDIGSVLHQATFFAQISASLVISFGYKLFNELIADFS